MARVLAGVIISGFVAYQLVSINANPQQLPHLQVVSKHASISGNLPALPPVPPGKSTTIGGAIISVDNVRDELTLKVYGEGTVKILFDERTLVFRDGKNIALRDLSPTGHASIQTMLDGTSVFAASIHILSQSPMGEFQGTVLKYIPETRTLTIAVVQLRDPIKLLLPVNTPVFRVGQIQFSSMSSGVSDLVKGAYISATFGSDNVGRSVASKIAVLATPGSTFIFGGELSSFDMHSGLLVLDNPQDNQSYQISFDPSLLTASQNLHTGDRIRVVATYDGNRYLASVLTIIN